MLILGGGSTRSLLISILFIIVPITLLFLFFTSIYLGTTFLQEHINAEEEGSSFLVVGLPNTRNKIRKWSVDHLHGIDITSLGPPVVAHSGNMTNIHGGAGGSHSISFLSLSSPADYYSHLLQRGSNASTTTSNHLRGFFSFPAHNTRANYTADSSSTLFRFAPPFFHAKLSSSSIHRLQEKSESSSLDLPNDTAGIHNTHESAKDSSSSSPMGEGPIV